MTWLAISCIPRRIISPSIIESIGDVLGDRLEFLLVMVEDYRRRVWRGDLVRPFLCASLHSGMADWTPDQAGYAHAMRKFTRLGTFAFNHSFPTNTDALSQLEPFIPPLQTFLPALGFENVDELLAHLESDDESDGDDDDGGEGGGGGARRRHLARMHRAMVSQCGVFFGPEAPTRSLRRVIQVTALFANQAQGNIVTCHDRGSKDFKFHFRPRADLERLLLPFDFRWARV